MSKKIDMGKNYESIAKIDFNKFTDKKARKWLKEIALLATSAHDRIGFVIDEVIKANKKNGTRP